MTEDAYTAAAREIVAGILDGHIVDGIVKVAAALRLSRPLVHVIHVNAGNDTNGNPRRAFIVLGGIGGPKVTYVEGYLGEAAIPAVDRAHCADGGTWTTLRVAPGAYRELVKGAQSR